MGKLILNRIASAIPVLFFVSIVVFMLTFLVPGDPAVSLSGENASPEMIERTRERLGLDRSPIEQYAGWLGGLLQGDLGASLFSGQSVVDAIIQRLPVTASLAAGSVFAGLLLGIPAGIVAGVFRGRWVDRLLTVGSSLGVATPNYVLGLVLVLLFSLQLRWFPATGYVALEDDPATWLKHLVLPCITLGLLIAAVVTRQLRSSIVGVLQQDYIRMARSKGVRRNAVVLKHALKNAMVPVVTVVGTQVAFLLGGSVIVEQIFGIPGIGNYAVIAVSSRDIPSIQGVVLFGAVVVLLVNMLVDISYGWLNPRVRPS